MAPAPTAPGACAAELSKDDSIAVALRQPAGAEFRRCALQVNPRHYSETYRGRPSTTDDAGYAEALIDKAEHLGITVMAVTDLPEETST